MNYVIAKIKGANEGFEKLYSGEDLYIVPNGLESAIPYDPSTLLEDDEWYKLENFSRYSFCMDILRCEFRSTDYTEVKKAKTDTIEYIFSYQQNLYFFQRILRSSIFMKKRLTLGDHVALDKGGKSIVINSLPDALYQKEQDILYFRKLQTIAPIFKGIDSLYKEATDEETDFFLQSDFIELNDKFNAKKVKTSNRKRIALALEVLNTFDSVQRREVLDYTHSYYPELEYDAQKGIFSIGDDNQLKFLLWGIEQRYYTTPVTQEKRVANSISVL